ncbi:MAG: NGG1p interacting factor NIF3 [bacterium]|nr:NGG1p interacting factor NIF3 [bacterium]
MKLATFFERAVAEGRKHDPRSPALIRREMKALAAAYEEMPAKRRRLFDRERLENPYPDSRILFGPPAAEIRSIMAGIDIDVGEIMLADRLRERGRRVDLVLAHHPVGRAYAGFHNVMRMQADIINRLGVPINIAEALLEERMREVERRVMAANHTRAVDAARLLDIPLACLHTPADNCAATYLQRLFGRKRPHTLREIIDLLVGIPEYERAVGNNAPPKIIAGAEDRRAGRIFVDMTGGTEGSVKTLEKLAQAGVGTLVCMHMSDKFLDEVKKQNVNVVVAGHVSSDALGLNLLLDAVCAKERIEVIPCSGFTRVERR